MIMHNDTEFQQGREKGKNLILEILGLKEHKGPLHTLYHALDEIDRMEPDLEKLGVCCGACAALAAHPILAYNVYRGKLIIPNLNSQHSDTL